MRRNQETHTVNHNGRLPMLVQSKRERERNKVRPVLEHSAAARGSMKLSIRTAIRTRAKPRLQGVACSVLAFFSQIRYPGLPSSTLCFASRTGTNSTGEPHQTALSARCNLTLAKTRRRRNASCFIFPFFLPEHRRLRSITRRQLGPSRMISPEAGVQDELRIG